MKSLPMWVRGSPRSARAHAIRCTTPAGVKVLTIDYESNRPFASCAESIEALHATKLEALDAEGNVQRVTDIEPPEGEDDGDPAAAELAPDGLTPRGSEMVLVARLLADAYRTGATQHREFADAAYTKLVEITATAFARLEGLEKAWTKMLNAQTRGAFVKGGGEDEEAQTGMAAMLQQFLANAAMGQAAAAGRKAAAGVPSSAPTTNGAHEGSE